MASAVSRDNPVISNTQDKSSYMEKKCKTYPYTPCKIPSNRFKDKHIGTPKTYSTACAILYKEMLKNLSNAPLVVPVYLQRPGSCIQNHHTVTVRPWVPRCCIGRCWYLCQCLQKLLLFIQLKVCLVRDRRSCRVFVKRKINQLSFNNLLCNSLAPRTDSYRVSPGDQQFPQEHWFCPQEYSPRVKASPSLSWSSPRGCQKHRAPFLPLPVVLPCLGSPSWQSSRARDNDNNPKRFILGQVRNQTCCLCGQKKGRTTPFKKHIQTQQHCHAFWCQLYSWSKTAWEKLSDIVVLYCFTTYSNALRNRIVFFSMCLQVRENINSHLQKTEPRSLILCFTLLRLVTF